MPVFPPETLPHDSSRDVVGSRHQQSVIVTKAASRDVVSNLSYSNGRILQASPRDRIPNRAFDSNMGLWKGPKTRHIINNDILCIASSIYFTQELPYNTH